MGRLFTQRKNIHTTLDQDTHRLLVSQSEVYGGMNQAIKCGLERLCDKSGLGVNCSDIGENNYEIKRLKIGILKLDQAIKGGVPEGFVVVIRGKPGVGKTTLCLYFIREGARVGEKCLFFSFIEPARQIISLYKQIFDNSHQDLLRFYSGWGLSLDNILSIIRDYAPSRIVLDSVNLQPGGLFRENLLWRNFWEHVKTHRITCFITEIQTTHPTEFDYVSDGVLTLTKKSGSSDVFTEVSKMRLTHIPTNALSLKLWEK